MSAFPSLPLFTDAFIADTSHLSALETGAYLMLLMVAWRSPECRLADDDSRLARWARVDQRTWVRIKPTVMEFWTLENGFWSQKRLSKERSVVSKRAEVARDNGQHGGRPKSLKLQDAENPTGSSRVTHGKAPNPNPSKNTSSLRSEVSAKHARKSTIADDAQPDEVDRKTADDAGMDAQTFRHQWALFRDHHRSVGSLMLDWHAAWRKWCGNWPKFSSINGHMNGARASARNCGPTMAELATMDLRPRYPDEPRTNPQAEPKPDTTDPKASGFVGRFPIEDRSSGVGQVLNLRSFSAVRG